MKIGFSLLIGVSIGLLIGWIVWGLHSGKVSDSNLPPRGSSDLQLVLQARDKALQESPDLETEYKAIQQAKINQEKELNDAMIKIDPKVAAIISKMDALHLHNNP